MKTNRNLIESSVADMAEYSQLQIDKFKLRILDDLSTLFNSILSLALVLLFGGFALLGLAIAAIWGLALLINSLMASILIVTGLFAVVAVVLYFNRDRLFINSIVRMMAGLLFHTDKTDNYDEK